MPRHSFTVVRRCLFLLAASGLWSLCGCSQTREQQLVGRWYNENMSIRFQADGSVLMNSRAGRATGRYEFHPQSDALAKDANLVLNVVRDGRQLQLKFHADLIARDRLRLSDLNERSSRSRPSQSIAEFTMLKRAVEEARTPTTKR